MTPTGEYGPPVGVPIITAIYPKTGPLEGGTQVTVQGANFQPDTSVIFGGTPTTTYLNIATDTGADPVYGDGWVATDNGGSGFGVWQFNTTSTNTSLNGRFMASAAAVDIGTPAWGLYANSSNLTETKRVLLNPLSIGQTFGVSMDNGLIGPGGNVGVALQNSAGLTLWEFYFTGGNQFYSISGGTTDVTWTSGGMTIEFALTSPTTYRTTISANGGIPRVVQGNLNANTNSIVTHFKAWNNNAGPGSDYDMYFNNIYITSNATSLVGGSLSTSVVVLSSSELIAVSPARESYGTVPLSVISGAKTATVANGFSYLNPLGSNIDLVGHIGGNVSAVAVVGPIVCYGEGLSLVVADFTISSAPIERGRIVLPQRINHIALVSNIAFVATGSSGVYAVDVSTPTAPSILGFYDTDGLAYCISVISNIAYVADNTAGLLILNVSNPSAIHKTATLETQGRVKRISAGQIAGKMYAFIAEDELATRVIDVTNPTIPLEVTNILARSGDGFTDVKVVGTNLYVTGDSSVGWIYNVANPTNPIYRGYFPSEGWAYFDVVGNRLYSCGDELIAVNLSVAPNPPQLGRFDIDGITCNGIAVSNGLAFAAMGPDGLQVVSITNPASITKRSALATMADVLCVEASGSKALIGDVEGLHIIDVTFPSRPSRLATLAGSRVSKLDLENGRATLVDLGSPVVRVVSVTNPAAPYVIGTYTNMDAYNVAAWGNTSVLVGATANSSELPTLDIIYIGVSSNPVRRGSLSLDTTSGVAAAIDLKNNFAFVGRPNKALDIVSISNPASPQKLGSIAITNHFREVAVSSNGNFIYVADWSRGILVVDATVRNSPVLSQIIDPSQTALTGSRCVRVSGSRLFASEYGYLFVFDISIPALPEMLGYYDIAGNGSVLSIDGDFIYVADGSDGMHILRMHDVGKPTVYIADPTTNQSFTSSNVFITISGTAFDDRGISRVTWENDRGGGGVATGTTNWSASAIQLAAGENHLTVTVEDQGGNVGTDSIDIAAAFPDLTPPSVAITGPTPDSEFTVNVAAVDLSGSAVDDTLLSSVDWTNAIGVGGAASISGETWRVDGIVLVEGPNVIEVKARDASGNSAIDSAVVFFMAADTNPPSVTVDFPSVYAVYETGYGSINLSGMATDDRGVSRVEWNSNDTKQGDANGTSPWSVNSVMLKTGLNVIEVIAYDDAGNSSSDSMSITYVPPPLDLGSVSLSNGVVELEMKGPLGGPYFLEVSSNLVEWIQLKTNVITSEEPIFIQDGAPNEQQIHFYRATSESAGD